MEESILTSIKKLLGIHEDDDSFDTDIIIHINSVLMVLHQIGMGSEPFSIEDESATWSDYFGDRADVAAIKTYIFMKVKLIFDPPSSPTVADAYRQSIAEFEFRINVAVDTSTGTA